MGANKMFNRLVQSLKKSGIGREEKALTIVELMIAAAVLLIVLAMGFSFFFFGVQAFDTGEKRSLVQTNARLASRILTDELRFAEDVEIYSTVPAHVNGINTIYLEEGNIIIRDEEGTERLLSGALSSEVTFTELVFSISPELNRMLVFSLGAEREGEQAYRLESEVTPLNQKSGIEDLSGGQTAIAVTYVIKPLEQQPSLNVSPRLIIEQMSADILFELSLTKEHFVTLTTADIILGGIFEGQVLVTDAYEIDDRTAEIILSGDFTEGIGVITVSASALQNDFELSAEVGVMEEYLFIIDEFIEDGIMGVSYDYQLTVIGGEPPYSFAVDPETPLPDELYIHAGEGRIYGTPNEVVQDYLLTVWVYDTVGDSHSRDFYFNIEEPFFNLSIASIGPGTTEPESPGNYIHQYGDVVTITAIPDFGAVFTGWDGDVADPDSAETTVTVTEDTTVIANFERTLIPIFLVPGGSFIVDDEGNYYIKLTGNHYRVIEYNAGTTADFQNKFINNEMPSKAELEDDLWTDDIRREPGSKTYWTHTRLNSNNYYYVDEDGTIVYGSSNTKRYLRKVITLDASAYVDPYSGTYADPHVLVLE
jgi:hypothetical protein